MRVNHGISRPVRITVFDSPGGDRKDDFAVIEVSNPAGVPREGICVGTFEKTTQPGGSAYSYDPVRVYFTGQPRGLDGKVSRIKVEGLLR